LQDPTTKLEEKRVTFRQDTLLNGIGGWFGE